jgi:hypothetical protein
MDPEIKGWLFGLIDEAADRSRDHLKWLASPEAVDEEDRDQQVAAETCAIEMAAKAVAALG